MVGTLRDQGDTVASVNRFWLVVPFILSLACNADSPALAGKLTDAVKARDIAQVRTLLAAGENVHEKVQRDYPINVAAAFGPAEMVAVLLEAGADIEQSGRDGLHPLHNAVLSGRKDIMALLIKRGVDVNSEEKRGRTALYSFACTAGSDIEIATMLLAAGADPKILDDEHLETALNCAVETGNIQLTKLLIAARLDVNHRNADGWTALHYAAHHLRYELAGLLIAAGADVNLPSKLGKTPLAVTPDDAAMKRLLIEAGAK
jgi:ankyrin repeat protein